MKVNNEYLVNFAAINDNQKGHHYR